MSTDIRQQNEQLYERIAAGDMAARNAIIELNAPLVVLKVQGYLAVFPHLEYLREEMNGEGNLALVEAANLMQAGPVTNPTGYLSSAIQKSIGHFIDNELYSSDRTARRNRQNGDVSEQFHKVPNSDFVLSKLDYDPSKEAELLDLILGCCESDEEKAIVDLRVKGYVDREIATTLDIPLTTVFMLRRELYQRVLATGEVTPD